LINSIDPKKACRDYLSCHKVVFQNYLYTVKEKNDFYELKHQTLRGHHSALNIELDPFREKATDPDHLIHLNFCFVQAQKRNKEILRQNPELLDSPQAVYLAMPTPQELVQALEEVINNIVRPSEQQLFASNVAQTLSHLLEVASAISIYR
jgi:hypothetical protein